MIPAIDAPAREIDTSIALFESINPIASPDPIPDHHPPRRSRRIPAERGNVMTLPVEVASQDPTDLPAPARYDYAHDRCGTSFSLFVAIVARRVRDLPLIKRSQSPTRTKSTVEQALACSFESFRVRQIL